MSPLPSLPSSPPCVAGRLALSACALLLASPSAPLAQEPAPADGGTEPAAEDPLRFDEARVRRAWETLWPSERAEVAEWLRFELSVQDTFQRELMSHALGLEARDPGLWPPLAAPPAYDARKHAPRQPIERRALPPGSSQAERERALFLGEPEPKALRRRFVYDWASGELRRDATLDPTETVFENACAGFPPELDLAVALVARALDDGRERAVLAAFAHAYSDRSGRVVPGVTLYDVWRSGETFETPDVEALGIVHDVLGEWKRWSAPVPGGQQAALYDELGGLFRRAQRYRGLREALADVYLMSTPPNRDGYEANRPRLHALWEHAISEPERLAPLLPGAADWQSFLEDWDRTCAADEELSATAIGREYALAQSEERVRRTLVWVLREFGAFERDARPQRDPAQRSSAAPAEELRDAPAPASGE